MYVQYVQLCKYYTFNFYPIGVILVGMNNGFSAIAIPDIMAEYTRFLTENTTASYLTPIQADMEQLSWFGRFSNTYSYFELHSTSICRKISFCMFRGYSTYKVMDLTSHSKCTIAGCLAEIRTRDRPVATWLHANFSWLRRNPS